MMTPTHVALVRASFSQVATIAPQAAAIFYGQLFQRDPALRALFRGDMTTQGDRLMTMIGAAVGLLDHPDRLDSVLRDLGSRHTGYGVEPAHYDTVGAALLATLEVGLGSDFTPEVRDAWQTLYARISEVMQGAEVMASMP
jgi:hemoglobin-like flavoprotein